jgi:hypothetical protein
VPDGAAHLERPPIAFCVRLRVGHRAVAKKHVRQLVGIDSHPDAFTAAIDAQAHQQLPASGELSNEVKLQVAINVHDGAFGFSRRGLIGLLQKVMHWMADAA